MPAQGSARVGIPIALGLLSALLFLSMAQPQAHGALLGFLAPLPIMAAALGLGQASTGLAILIAMAACGTVAQPHFAGAYALVVGLPALIVANRALRLTTGKGGEIGWCPPGRVLCWLTLVAAVAFCALAAMVGVMEQAPTGFAAEFGSDFGGGIRGWLSHPLDQALDGLGDQITADERRNLVKVLSATLPALIMGTWVVMSCLNAMLAQAILAKLGQAKRPSPSYLDLDLAPWAPALPLIAALVGAVTNGDIAYVAFNMVAIGGLPFAALGIATVHGALARGKLASRPAAGLGLVAFYVALLLFSGWALVPLSIVGLARFVRIRFDRRAADKRGEMEDGNHSAGAD